MLENSLIDLAAGASIAQTVSKIPTNEDLLTAVATILYATVTSDNNVDPKEIERLKEILKTHFSASEEKISNLLELAAKLATQENNYKQFIELINSSYSVEQRQKMLALSWKLIAADGIIEKLEANYSVKLRQDFGLSVEQAICARKAVENRQI